MENVIKFARSYSYKLSLNLLSNQNLVNCQFLQVNYDSAVTAGGDLLVFGNYDLEITIAESYRNTAHHYVRYRTEAFREWLRIPELQNGDVSGVRTSVQVEGAGCKATEGELLATLEVKAVVRVKARPPAVPAVAEPKVAEPVTAPVEKLPSQGSADLFKELEELRAYIKRQVRGRVHVLSLNGVQVITDGEVDDTEGA